MASMTSFIPNQHEVLLCQACSEAASIKAARAISADMGKNPYCQAPCDLTKVEQTAETGLMPMWTRYDNWNFSPSSFPSATAHI